MIEKRALQIVVALGSLIPIIAGGMGIWLGPHMLGVTAEADLGSHFRYLSGLLLGIGIGYLATIPRIETKQSHFGLLTAIVFAGGLGRLISIFVAGWPSASMRAALVMELVVTPALAIWQRRVASRLLGQTMGRTRKA